MADSDITPSQPVTDGLYPSAEKPTAKWLVTDAFIPRKRTLDQELGQYVSLKLKEKDAPASLAMWENETIKVMEEVVRAAGKEEAVAGLVESVRMQRLLQTDSCGKYQKAIYSEVADVTIPPEANAKLQALNPSHQPARAEETGPRGSTVPGLKPPGYDVRSR